MNDNDIVLSFGVFCDSFVIDKTDKLSLISIFDKIYSEKFPSIHPRICFVARFFSKTAKTSKMRVDISSAAGKLISSGESELKFENPDLVATVIFDFFNFTIPDTGKYIGSIYVDDKKIESSAYFVGVIKN